MRLARLAACGVLALSLAACDGLDGGSQRQFEDDAYLLPPGTVEAWRVSPTVDARLSLLAPEPNPADGGDLVSVRLDVSYAEPGGFALYRLLADGQLDLVAEAPGVSSPWFYSLSFLGRDADPLGRPGVYRLLVLDASDRVIAFGDFTLRS